MCMLGWGAVRRARRVWSERCWQTCKRLVNDLILKGCPLCLPANLESDFGGTALGSTAGHRPP